MAGNRLVTDTRTFLCSLAEQGMEGGTEGSVLGYMTKLLR